MTDGPIAVAKFDRRTIADAIIARFDDATIEACANSFGDNDRLQWFFVDDILPPHIARAIYQAFPPEGSMRQRRSLRESKSIAAQMNQFNPLLEEAIFAFQDARIVDLVTKITSLSDLHPDDQLYAGGISLMSEGNFLNPHLDNSHDNDRTMYRVLNLLYYCTPEWKLENGGNLELWPGGVKADPVTIESRFNRLVIMSTGPDSWHSVSRVKAPVKRCCVSNYYFSSNPVGHTPYTRVTTFRGRPEQPVRDLVLRGEAALRQAIRSIKPDGLVKTTHVYKRSDDGSDA